MIDQTRFVYGLGAVGLGVLGLMVGDFALQWQPVPKDIAFRTELAWLSAALLIVGGLATIWRRTSALGSLSLGLMYGVWVVALHLPVALADASQIASWSAVAEALALSLGGLVGWAAVARPDLAPIGRRLFGLAPVIFGLAHFGYAKFTASMVPVWLPAPLVWAYLTGVGHMAGGLALIAGVQARLAATLLALMYAAFAVLLHLPRVIAAPDSRIEWTMLLIAISLTGAAWNVREPRKAL
ncbi:MAG: DoxX family membrane protein [Alphaproteobacteria bacterium]|nr:DoxX family membrane protein [Alphaproteobacteria bacterium]MBU1516994.1 DoxX family membrane protein [Alphaproteobacteria bacterium]MBU2093574.1 DoxX family membrane protein [Alphaproteobacteria bacterium]MBU2152856.1 DoxX family membrane protein [Alphaproteobacteria bacterium]MBU2305562.1 DoxX family membrane protein [Alphaproteobacteria bacterium]